jgi:hypothetical protein
MHWFSNGVALLAALGIIGIGVMYLSNPRAMTSNFGLPLPETGANTTWWLRLKGMRDIVSGLVVLAVEFRGEPRMLGIVLLIEALIPTSDMSLILAARGNARTAFGVHGVTAVLMVLGAVPLIAGAA